MRCCCCYWYVTDVVALVVAVVVVAVVVVAVVVAVVVGDVVSKTFFGQNKFVTVIQTNFEGGISNGIILISIKFPDRVRDLP